MQIFLNLRMMLIVQSMTGGKKKNRRSVGFGAWNFHLPNPRIWWLGMTGYWIWSVLKWFNNFKWTEKSKEFIIVRIKGVWDHWSTWTRMIVNATDFDPDCWYIETYADVLLLCGKVLLHMPPLQMYSFALNTCNSEENEKHPHLCLALCSMI